MLARILELDRRTNWAEEMQRQMSRACHDLGANTGAFTSGPPMDLFDEPDRYRLIIDLPGVMPEEVDVQLDGRRLTVLAERNIPKNEESKALLTERRSLRFKRTVILPSTVASDEIVAVVRHGVLSVELPKTESTAPRKIEVTSLQ